VKVKDIFFYSLGAVIVISFFVVLTALIMQGSNPDAVNIMLGALTSAMGIVVGYFYGSSSSSAKKDETIGTMVQNLPPTPPNQTIIPIP